MPELAGQVINAHQDKAERMISQVRDWLNSQRGASPLLPARRKMDRVSEGFQEDDARLLSAALITEDETTYADGIALIQDWVERKITVPRNP